MKIVVCYYVNNFFYIYIYINDKFVACLLQPIT